ncbi:MAG: glycosyltransferase family 2 protein [Planctomycetota bacterium]
MADVSIIIVNYNTREHLLRCIGTVLEQTKRMECRIVVIDNGSSDNSAEAVRQAFPAITILCNKQNYGFAKAVNQGLRAVQDNRYHLILNSDAALNDGYLEKTVGFLEAHPQCAIVSGQLLNADGSRQNSFDNFPSLLSETFGKGLLRTVFPGKYPSKKQAYSSPLEVESVIGAAMIVRQRAIDDAGLLDEDYFFFLEETDWCYRMKQKGWSICFLPDATANHLQGETKKLVLIPAKIEYLNSLYKFFRKRRSPLTYWLLRLIKPAKIIIGLAANLVLNILTLGLAGRFRRALKLYALLTLWHLRFCTEKMTLRYKSSPRT